MLLELRCTAVACLQTVFTVLPWHNKSSDQSRLGSSTRLTAGLQCRCLFVLPVLSFPLLLCPDAKFHAAFASMLGQQASSHAIFHARQDSCSSRRMLSSVAWNGQILTDRRLIKRIAVNCKASHHTMQAA